MIVPDSFKHNVLQQLHNQSGHLGFHKTLEKLKERYYWPGYENDVGLWIQECTQCQLVGIQVHLLTATDLAVHVDPQPVIMITLAC